MEEKGNEVSLNANSSANAGNYNIDETGHQKKTSEEQNYSGNKPENIGKSADQGNSADKGNEDEPQVNKDELPDTNTTPTDKQWGDTQLNKGLESQVRDAEGS